MTPAALERRISVLEAAILPRPAVQVPDALALMVAAGMQPDPWQEAVAQSEADRILLNCYRQLGKTQIAAAIALETAMHEPGALVLVLSPSLRQSSESFRQIVSLYRPWAGQIPSEAESLLKMELAKRAGRCWGLWSNSGTMA